MRTALNFLAVLGAIAILVIFGGYAAGTPGVVFVFLTFFIWSII